VEVVLPRGRGTPLPHHHRRSGHGHHALVVCRGVVGRGRVGSRFPLAELHPKWAALQLDRTSARRG